MEVTVQAEAVIPRLARRAQAGDAGALDELVAELQPTVVRTVRLVVGSGSWAAEDAAQEALLEVARHIGQLREPEAARTWALRIATRRAVRVARRERFLRLVRAPLDELVEAVSREEDGRSTALKAAFDRLPSRLRAVAVLRLELGLSEAETAEVLGCSVGTVKSNLHDARKRLTSDLASSGYAPVTQTKETER